MSAGISDAMRTLYERAKDSMTVGELEVIGDLTDLASAEARRLASVCEGIACLVAADEGADNNAGNFQSGGDVAYLLFSLSHGLATISGMVEIGAEARYKADAIRRQGQGGRT